jgi:hypothetical protein
MNNKQVDDHDAAMALVPWYKQGWPWFLISFPLTSVLLGIMMVVLALNTNNSLVVDDYYREGKAINQRIGRDTKAAERGLSALINTQSAEGIVLDLSQKRAASNPEAMPWPEELSLRLVHVTEADLDQNHLFSHMGGGRYIDTKGHWPETGRWRIHVQSVVDFDWRLVSETIVLGDPADITIEAYYGR